MDKFVEYAINALLRHGFAITGLDTSGSLRSVRGGRNSPNKTTSLTIEIIPLTNFQIVAVLAEAEVNPYPPLLSLKTLTRYSFPLREIDEESVSVLISEILEKAQERTIQWN